MLTDIVVNLGTDAISGYISIAAIPYIGDVLAEVVSESTLQIVPGMQVSNDTDQWKKNAISFEVICRHGSWRDGTSDLRREGASDPSGRVVRGRGDHSQIV